MYRQVAAPPTRRTVLALAFTAPAVGGGASTRSIAVPPRAHSITAPGIVPSPLPERRVGIAYSLWHTNDRWQEAPTSNKPWGIPELGFYRSDDPAILAKHAAWLSGAGVDFVVADWSNDLGIDVRQNGGMSTLRFIEQATIALFDSWAAQPASPLIVLMIGNPGAPGAINDGKLTAKADEVHAIFVSDASRSRMLQTYLGKPLLLVYVGTPSPSGHGLPAWQDDRFTVRFMTGFLTQQRTLLDPGGISRFGYWSWEDRRQPTYSVFQGHPECMTVVAAWRGKDTPGRDDGRSYLQQWRYARKVGARFVLAGTFNEWWVSEQINAGASKDIEPSNDFGWRYMEILKQQASLFKAGK